MGELATLENWCHLYPNVLTSGRVTHYIDPALNEEDRTAEQDRLNEVDPLMDKLKSLAEDKPMEGSETNYTIKHFGSSQ